MVRLMLDLSAFYIEEQAPSPRWTHDIHDYMPELPAPLCKKTHQLKLSRHNTSTIKHTFLAHQSKTTSQPAGHSIEKLFPIMSSK